MSPALSTAHLDWASIALLGSLHGLNPAMGWLFAVSLGLQAQRGRAVWFALAPLALGHALAVAAAVAAAAALGVVLPLTVVRWVAAAGLLGFAVVHLRPHTHLPWGVGGMRVGPRELTAWSFLVASAHGAGLMVLPFVLGPASMSGDAPMQAAAGGHAAHMGGMAASGDTTAVLLATALHTAGYLTVSGAIAWVVYDRVGLRFLRSAWININVIWAVALIVTAVATAPVKLFS